MADDKGGGGGWEWTALEIVLVLLLAIALVDKLQGGKGIFAFKETEKTPAAPKTQTISNIDEQCGLILNHPRPLESVKNAVLVSGSTEGCDWYSTPQEALYAQVVDSKGKPISQYTAIVPESFADQYATFYATIPFTAPAAAGTGYLILIPAVTTSGNAPTARVPIQITK